MCGFVGTVKVVVLAGGIGPEREVSLQSGCCVAKALEKAGLQVAVRDISPDDLSALEEGSADVFFIALHGEFGEDGQLQQILEDRSICYTGSSSAASKLAFDKLTSKELFGRAQVTTPKAIEVREGLNIKQVERELARMGEKFVIKPVRQGSTIGVSVADNPRLAVETSMKCLEKFGDCMIEQYIVGRELTVGILSDKALPVIEIRPKSGFYDYDAKYINEQTEFLFDTIAPSMAEKIQADVLACYNVLGLRHFARVDLILDNDEKTYILEANSIPGLTSHSLVPKAAARAGISMSDLCMRIVNAALAEKTPKAAQGVTQPSSNHPDSRMPQVMEP
ncbi:MAG: D-alanine--D-alanine ligase [Sedimentisphaerales bacterium]|nr:D-alanine--D-alanine ligase [Sedimentisphaerales bacterium]